MDLEFVLNDDLYIADFTASGDFNLHIEQQSAGFVDVYQSSIADGKYDIVKGVAHTYREVFDEDFVGVVYPKYIRVVLQRAPSKAVVTFA